MVDAGTADRVRASVERATVTVVSDDHLVTVTAGSGGALTELDLPDQALRKQPSALATAILRTIGRATTELNERLAADLGEFTAGRADPAALLAGSLPAPAPGGSTQQPQPGDRHDAGDGPTLPDGVDPGGADTVDRLRAAAARTLDEYAAVRQELAEATAIARSPDGSVTATVRSGGTVTDLHLDEAALRRGRANLSRQVLAAIGRARADAATSAAGRVQELVGSSIPIVELVAEAIPAELRGDDGADRPRGGAR